MAQATNNEETSHIIRWCLGRLSAPPKDCVSLDVESLLQEYLAQHRSPPVDVEALSQLRRCRLERCVLPDRVSGLLVPIDNGFVIKLNGRGPGKNKRRERFTIAHEIAHTFFYRFGANGHLEKISGPLSYYEEERLCDFAAQHILVPRQLIQDSPLASVRDPDLGVIIATARTFGVSSEVAARRLKEEGGAFSEVGLCQWVAEDVYKQTRRTVFSASDRFRPLVLTWMIPPNPASRIPQPRGSRVPAKSPLWELCAGQRTSVEGAEMHLGNKLTARLGRALIRKVKDKPVRVLATITDLTEIQKNGPSSIPHKRRPSAGAKRRECPLCLRAFRPMTDAQWRNVWQLHERLSTRHQRLLGQSL